MGERERKVNVLDSVGTGLSSGDESQELENSRPAAERMEASSVLGRNMSIRDQRFSSQVVVFWIWAAVLMRFREAIRWGMSIASSWAIMPPIDTPDTFNCRGSVQPRWSRSSTRSFAISLVE